MPDQGAESSQTVANQAIASSSPALASASHQLVVSEAVSAAFASPLLPSFDRAGSRVVGRGEADWRSWFAVSDLATASLEQAGRSLARLAQARGLTPPKLALDRRLASLWFDLTTRPEDWRIPSLWDPLAGNYRAKDGWVRLHTNAPHHRQAALSVLGAAQEQAELASRVAAWDSEALETAVIAAGGCAAKLLSFAQWQALPAGQAVAAQPLVAWQNQGETEAAAQHSDAPEATPERPLAGLKVLDLTRVLAGPAATRLLAGFGAEVLRIDPPQWSEEAVAIEMALGKRCALLDLTKQADRARFEVLLGEADLLVHGYRDGALAGLGYGQEARRRLNPRLVDVALNAYGWEGPWRERRGFDTIVQQTSGLADYGRQGDSEAPPVMLPVQALDHATGYLLAAAACEVLAARLVGGRLVSARLSLARTALLLWQTRRQSCQGEALSAEERDFAPGVEQTPWGAMRRVAFPLTLNAQGPCWPRPAGPYKSAAARW